MPRMKHLQLFIFLFTILLIASCASKEHTNEESVIQKEDLSDDNTIPMEWSIQVYGDQSITPNRSISLALDGKFFPIDTVPAIDIILPKDYQDYDIPAEAKIAAGGWWAGLGNYYYTLQDGEQRVIVMQGWQDEMQEDEGFHYEEVRRIVLSK
ncbi:MAG: hypothetical protein AAF242_13560 [Bacteroidota bacterium]